jgi:hypothetical protein
MHITHRSVDRFLAQCETTLNLIDYVPIISSYSGALRILAGVVEIAAGAAFVSLEIIHALLQDSNYPFLKSWNGIAYCLHGLGNIIRGLIAIFPGINLSLVLYDYKIGRMNYRHEIVEKNTYPLNQEELWERIRGLCD